MERESPTDLMAAGLIDQLAAPAVFLDQDGIILRHNAAWVDWIADDPTPVFGPSINSLIDPDQSKDFADFMACVADHTKQGAIFNTTHGTRSIWLTAVHGHAKWNSGILGMIAPKSQADIELAKIQDSINDLQVLQDRWQYAMKSDLHGLFDIDYVTKERYHSDGWHSMRGLSERTAEDQTFAALLSRIHPDDRARISQRELDVEAGAFDSFNDEFRERHADGHWIWILTKGDVVSRFPDGRPKRIIGTDIDISHLKALGGQNDDLSQRLELALHTSGIGVWEFDIDAQRPSWDARMYDIYGIDAPKEDADRYIWEDMLHPEDRDRIVAISDEAVALRKNFDLAFRIVRPDGTIRHIQSTGRHYTDANGIAKVIGVNWDITQQEQQAQALRDAHAKSEKQNADLEAARLEMEHQSQHDALTDLPNRRMLTRYCDDARQRKRTIQSRSAMLHIDIDRFKQINDSLGHEAGDAVLRHVADILRNAATPNSITARVGGDEFVVFIEHAPHDAALGYWANNIIKETKRPFIFQGHECRFGISVGIAIDNGADLLEDTLFSHADLALYQAKQEGRGRLCFYKPELKSTAVAKRQCADDILIGLDEGQFCCVYQPQYDSFTLDIIGAEALVRWDHPTRGRLGPDAFLDIAEDLDIVAKIDQAVFESALADSRKWRAGGKNVPQISVNVSGKRLLDPLLPARIAHLAEEPQSFAFELLESVFLDDPDDILSKNLASIRDLGVAIEVDDFGTGHASMVGLLNLQPDRLKIDRQLIMPLVRSQQQRRLVASIIEIGHVLGIEVVAEGVETQEHISVLAGLGCNYLQGYGLAKPMPADDLYALLPDI